MIAQSLDDYLQRIRELFIELDIPENLPAARGLNLCRQPAEWIVAETDMFDAAGIKKSEIFFDLRCV